MAGRRSIGLVAVHFPHTSQTAKLVVHSLPPFLLIALVATDFLLQFLRFAILVQVVDFSSLSYDSVPHLGFAVEPKVLSCTYLSSFWQLRG